MIDLATASAQWRVATVMAIRYETATVKTITFDVPGWPGHLGGQHVDLRLTAEDGYVAQRSYSIASGAGSGQLVELTVDAVPDGEVSGFLHEGLRVGDRIEIRGPIGGYFAWSAAHDYGLLLIAGGSGIVPLMSMLRSRAAAGATHPARLLYSSRSVDQIIYRAELDRLAAQGAQFSLTHTLTRNAPSGWTGEQGRIDRVMLTRRQFTPVGNPDVYVCGPTTFVETIAEHLVAMGHRGSNVRTERFGPTGAIRK
ncbi:ferredoxin-NADP reductase [Rhizobium binae]|uniref:Ferredoxin-NADP reductase n=1 Tax=Rhizobium binae TaxID=1138190 RepID=A0ABV2MFM0_9HYPH|nr:ferredoxin reductase [Rhizobium binae]MBX4994779.1 oxidoreductase [Rhizobium binae]NKL49818.1 oxidoreductase [Rhizobium leguminosarum bv. viciae]QSY85310.1 ferredoxin reductase [Rhizobium binae]